MTISPPVVLPVGWRVAQLRGDGYALVNDRTGQSIIASDEIHDGRRWLHVSTAFVDRLPTWLELRDLKNWLIGREKLAIQVLPRESEYVNIHPNCLHLFSPLDGPDPIPDFTQGSGSL